MKPEFALNLARDGIALLHRAGPGWRLLGSVAIDDPARDARLARLRTTAQRLAPRGFATKLIIPNSEILYTEVPVTGRDLTERRRQIRAALDGLTPYALDELVFDWRDTDTGALVAVVARETLEEVEQIARAHRFNPIYFTAAPEPAQFPDAPFLGASSLIDTLVPDGDQLAPDAAILRIADALPPADPDPEPERAEASRAARQPEPAGVADPVRQPAPAGKPEAAHAAAAPAAEVPRPATAGSVVAASGPEDMAGHAPSLATAQATAPRSASAQPATAAPPSEPAQAAPAQPAAAETARAASPTVSLLRKPVDWLRRRRPHPAPKSDDSNEAAAPAVGLATRTANAALKGAHDAAARPLAGAGIKGASKAAKRGRGAKKRGAGKGAPAGMERGAGAASPSPRPSDAPAAPREKIGAANADAGKSGATAQPRPLKAAPLGPDDEPRTVFGALEQEQARARRRTALIAAAVSLFVIGIGLWGAVIWWGERSAPLFTDLVPSAETDAPLTATTAPSAPPQPRSDTGAGLTAPAAGPPAAADPAAQAAAPIARAPVAPEVDALPATAGTATAEPDPVPTGTEESQLASVPDAATEQAGPDSSALPRLDTDTSAVAATPAPDRDAAGRSELDGGGVIAVTPEAAFGPQPRIEIVDGTPPATPEMRRAVIGVEPVIVSDPALADFRPMPRPESVREAAPEVPAETAGDDEASRATVADDASVADAGTIPAPPARPETLAAAETVAAAASARVQPESDAFATATARAVAVALRPNARPEDFASSQAVQAAIDSAPVTRGSVQGAATPAAAAPVSAPSLPSSAEVATAATDQRAMNLRRMNLIGVFGTSSNRRALVRMSNGRMVRVGVGDELDGGQVAAIDDSALRYVKQGRNHVLRVGGDS